MFLITHFRKNYYCPHLTEQELKLRKWNKYINVTQLRTGEFRILFESVWFQHHKSFILFEQDFWKSDFFSLFFFFSIREFQHPLCTKANKETKKQTKNNPSGLSLPNDFLTSWLFLRSSVVRLWSLRTWLGFGSQ